ncbi:hypothetical protein [Trueperella pyogenes]|uniref:hypothetical protein n=1 Tax=Trueperella pyogenes TaxID=1661 RepID=UPI003DA7BE41
MRSLTPSTEDYLKNIWSISEWSGDEVVPIELARRLGLSPRPSPKRSRSSAPSDSSITAATARSV